MRPNREVMVAPMAPGNLAPYRGWVGQVTHVDGRIARVVVRAPFGEREEVVSVDARHLVAHAAPPKPAESPEVTALKEKVAITARRLAREHGLCDVVDRALREVGIEPLPEQMIEITLRIPESKFDFGGDGDPGDEINFYEEVANQLERVFEDVRYDTNVRLGYVSHVDFKDMTDFEKEGYE